MKRLICEKTGSRECLGRNGTQQRTSEFKKDKELEQIPLNVSNDAMPEQTTGNLTKIFRC